MDFRLQVKSYANSCMCFSHSVRPGKGIRMKANDCEMSGIWLSKIPLHRELSHVNRPNIMETLSGSIHVPLCHIEYILEWLLNSNTHCY